MVELVHFFLLKLIHRQIKKIIAEFMKHRSIAKRVQTINDYLRKQGSDKADPKELDLLLGEITIMHARAELYIRFLRRRISVSILNYFIKLITLDKSK